MQNSISSALAKVDGSSKPSAHSSAGNNDRSSTQADTPFNQLFSKAQRAGSNDSANAIAQTGDPQISTEDDKFSDASVDSDIDGEVTSKSEPDVSVSDRQPTEELGGISPPENSDEADVVVTWQQSQIDWSKQSIALGSNQGTSANANLNTAGTLLNLDADAANAQFSFAANSASLAKAAQAIELKSDFTAGLDLTASSQTRMLDNAVVRAPPNLTMTQNALTDPAWSQAMAAKISWMVGGGVHTATLQLRPAELGSIHIQLTVEGSNTSVQIQTQHKDTSDLMEKMMPRLHSAMENQGLRLEDTKVSHNPNLNDGQQPGGDRSGAANKGGDIDQASVAENGVDDDGNAIEPKSATVILQNRSVDYYA